MPTASQESVELVRQLHAAQGQLSAVEARLKTIELESLDTNLRLAASEQANRDLRRVDEDRITQVTQLATELAQMHGAKIAERDASLIQEAELTSLRAKLATRTDELNKEHQLNLAADRARDLIVARNLHIVDVHDNASDGSGQRSFGRIFYSEGKSFVFYAYDLTDPGQKNAGIDFHVWGEKSGATQPVRNLGTLHSDDTRDGRWLFTLDDARVLAQIDSVFVTVESPKRAITKPEGKKVLFAYLGDKANHP